MAGASIAGSPAVFATISKRPLKRATPFAS
jgi:hypothetical protein